MRTPWMLAVLACTAVLHAVFIVRGSQVLAGRRHFVLFDDASISMRYAENLANGHGLVWNPGEPAVEGITNPLWALWMSVLHLLGVPRATVGLGVMVSSSLLVLACVVMAAAVARRLAPELRAAPPVAAVLTATAYPLAFWSLRGMEVGAVAAAALGAVILALDWVADPDDRPWRLHAVGVLVIAMVAIRLDAAVLAIVLAGWCVTQVAPSCRRRAAVVLGSWLVGGVLVMTAARLAYYGDLLPNTYYLKATGVSMGVRLGQGTRALLDVVALTLVVPLVLAAGGVARAVAGGRAARVALPVCMVLAQLAYSVWTGGDAWEEVGYANRYLATVLPLLAVLGGMGVAGLADFGRPAFRPVARTVAVAGGIGCLFVALWHPDALTAAVIGGWDPWRIPLGIAGAGAIVIGLVPAVVSGATATLHPGGATAGRAVLAGVLTLAVVLVAHGNAGLRWHDNGPAYLESDLTWAEEGLLIGACTTEDTTVGVFAAGQIIYYSDRPGVDLLGKSDRVVARISSTDESARPGHNKFSFERSIDELRPDLITGTGVGMPEDLVTRAELLGYESTGRWLIHRDARGIDREGLVRGLAGGPERCRIPT